MLLITFANEDFRSFKFDGFCFYIPRSAGYSLDFVILTRPEVYFDLEN